MVVVVRFKGGWLYRAGVGSRRNRLRWGQKRKVSRWPQGMSLNIIKKMNDSPLAGGGKGSSGITRECETHPGRVPVASGGYESGSGSWKTEIDRDSTPRRYTWSISSER